MKPIEFTKKRINKIAYIVQYNPDGARQLLAQYGYEVPDDLTELLKALQELIRNEGRPAIHDLLKLHPDKELILKSNGKGTEEPHLCAKCQHDSFDGDEEIDIYRISTRELEQYYQSLKEALRDDPNDEVALADLELVSSELQYRKARNNAFQNATNSSRSGSAESKQMVCLGLGLAFVLGVVVAKL